MLIKNNLDMTREKAIKIVKEFINGTCLHLVDQEALETLIPELAESEDERIRKCLCDIVNWLGFDSSFFLCNGVAKTDVLAYLEKQKECVSNNFDDVWDEEDCEEIIAEGQKLSPRFKELLKEVCHAWYDRGAKLEKRQEQKPVKMEVYEVGKGTTVCGQDYKCKKDYQAGNCRYIKDAIYHCGRDGYLTDQNGISWSCTPEWFKEYIQSNAEWAEEEKNRFVSGQFLQCKLSFDSFKEGEHYWLEYVGDDMYVGRSDNVLGQRFHITPRQLYTLFSQQLEEVQGPPQEEKQASLNYEPPFNENPSDKEIIEALIKHLKEQDGFLTAINCISTKAILSWLEKQQEQKPVDYETELKKCKDNPLYFFDKYVSIKQKPAEWSEEDEEMLKDIISGLKAQKLLIFAHENQGKAQMNARIDWLQSLPERFNLQPKPEWGEEDEKMLQSIIKDFRAGKVSTIGQERWLKSLRPQYHGDVTMTEAYKMGVEAGKASSWKPSKEQMDALDKAIPVCMGVVGRDEIAPLESLCEQLEKL
jgi:hypothetical protein